MSFYGTFDYGEGVYGDGSSPQPELRQRIPWVFQAISDPDLYEFAINPLDVSMPSVQKTFTEQKTASGKSVLFQGRDQVQRMSFSGTILTQLHFEIFEEWFSKEKQVSITDDLGNQFWVYLTSFTPTRNYSARFPWRHEYNAEAIMLSWN